MATENNFKTRKLSKILHCSRNKADYIEKISLDPNSTSSVMQVKFYMTNTTSHQLYG